MPISSKRAAGEIGWPVAASTGTLVLDAGTNVQTGSGTLTNETTGTIETHIASTTKYGQLTGSGAVQLAGTLHVVLDGTYVKVSMAGGGDWRFRGR